MSDGRRPQDPTMDEILSSIRKIIEQDVTRGAAAPGDSATAASRPDVAGPTLGLGVSIGGPSRREPAPAIDDDDVLLLTNLVEESEPTSPPPSARPSPVAPLDAAAAASPVIARTPTHAGALAVGSSPGMPDVTASSPAAARVSVSRDAGDLSRAAAGAPVDQPVAADPMRAAMDRLARAVQDAEPPAEASDPGPVVPAGRTLEDIVRDALRPLLQEWIDKNLPLLVERVIERELQRRNKL